MLSLPSRQTRIQFCLPALSLLIVGLAVTSCMSSDRHSTSYSISEQNYNGNVNRQQIIASSALGELVGDLDTIEMFMDAGDNLDADQKVNVRTDLERIRSLFSQLNVSSVALPVVEEFSGTTLRSASLDADDSTYDTINVNFDAWALNVYCFSRDAAKLRGTFFQNGSKKPKDFEDDTKATLQDLKLVYDYLGIKRSLPSASELTADQADKIFDFSRKWTSDFAEGRSDAQK